MMAGALSSFSRKGAKLAEEARRDRAGYDESATKTEAA